jgi:hypothetical protein
MDLPGYDIWKTTPPEDPRCTCNREDCEECEQAAAEEAAYDRHIDDKIDEAREREWDR